MRNKKIEILVAFLITVSLNPCRNELNAQSQSQLKPRVIVLTDLKRVHETDDLQSLVRLLAFADQVEIEGIIISSGFNYWKPEHIEEGNQLVWEIIEAYGKSVGNLMKMSGQNGFLLNEDQQLIGYWPSEKQLIRSIAIGTPLVGMSEVGENHDSQGSRLIESIIDEPDQRPVYILAWGGANVLAQCLWNISENPLKQRNEKAVISFLKKIRVISIGDQDAAWKDRQSSDHSNNSHYWMRTKFPELIWVKIWGNPFARLSNPMQAFYQMHIQGHGYLGDKYPDHSNSVEGDTPSLWYVLPLSYGDPEQPELASIIGSFSRDEKSPTPNFYYPTNEQVITNKSVVEAEYISFWNEFATRMDWSRSGTGNRPPIIRINGKQSAGFYKIQAKAGTDIWIDASETEDMERDKLTFEWSLITLSENFSENILLENYKEKIKIFIPANALKKQVHVLLKVKDDGAGHHLTAYKRIIINIQ